MMMSSQTYTSTAIPRQFLTDILAFMSPHVARKTKLGFKCAVVGDTVKVTLPVVGVFVRRRGTCFSKLAFFVKAFKTALFILPNAFVENFIYTSTTGSNTLIISFNKYNNNNISDTYTTPSSPNINRASTMGNGQLIQINILM